MKKNIVIFFTLLTFSTAVAQDTIVKKWKFTLQLDNRFTRLNEKNVTIFGGKAGFAYKNLTRIGIGTSFALKPISNDFVDVNTGQTVENTTGFWYFSVFNDWIIFKNKRWNCYVTEQIGIGAPRFTKSINGQIVSDENVTLIINELSAQAQYKFLPWLGAGAGLGYRHSLNKDSFVRSAVNGPVFIAKVIIYPGAIFSFLEF